MIRGRSRNTSSLYWAQSETFRAQMQVVIGKVYCKVFALMENPNKGAMDDALKNLPHGPEFRFIDHMVSLIPGKKGNAVYRIRGDEPFLAGHFPGQPIFPGVLLLEAGAQLAGVVAQSDPAHKQLKNLKLTAMRAVKILGSATPGETLSIDAEISGRLANLVQADVKIACNGNALLQAAVTLSGDAPLVLP